MKSKSIKQIRYGVVGLGHIAQVAVLPAFRQASKNSILTAFVTNDRKKASKLSKKYGISHIYRYDEFDDLLKADIVDALYICLPNNLHTEYSVRALKAGVHVLCEKPLALSEKDCQKIADAAESSGAQIMTAYRLHFEEANLEALKLCKTRKLGDLRYFSSDFSYQLADAGNIRVRKETGGGPLWDIGIYCINAVRTLFQAEPQEVFAFAAAGDKKRFSEVEQGVSAVLRFSQDRLATFTCSFGADTAAYYDVYGSKGSLRVENAYEYATARKLIVRKDGELKTTKSFKKVDQFAPEIVYFSNCIIKNKKPEPSAQEGLADVRVIRALYESIEKRKPIRLADFGEHQGPSDDMRSNFKGHSEPETVNVHSPSN